jgi:hypothetical protein
VVSKTSVAALTASLALVLFAGCGASREHGPGARGNTTIKYLGRAYTLASARTPEGSAYVITGRPYRFWGQDHVELNLHFANPRSVEGEGGSQTSSPPLEVDTQSGCDGRRFGILYAVMSAPGVAAVFRTRRGLIELHEASLPAPLHPDARLLYANMPAESAELLVRMRDGALAPYGAGIGFGGLDPRCGRAELAASVHREMECMTRKRQAQWASCVPGPAALGAPIVHRFGG